MSVTCETSFGFLLNLFRLCFIHGPPNALSQDVPALIGPAGGPTCVKVLTCSLAFFFFLYDRQHFFLFFFFLGRMYSFMGGGLFCAGVGNILLIVSTATDYWMQYRHSSNYMHQGLWRYCVPGKCMTHTDSIGEDCCVFPPGRPSFIFIRLLTTSPWPRLSPLHTLGFPPSWLQRSQINKNKEWRT